MKLTKKVRYGLRTILEIAASKEGMLQKDIAKNQQIPLKFLDAIITGLKIKGLIRNVKGKKSGYVLAKNASLITIYDVYLAFEPDLCIVDCICDCNMCSLSENCLMLGIWIKINYEIVASLSQYTIQDILNRGFKIDGQI
ncbi:MAG: Rrf2 family transcriptional regulator [Salinivirgaceae bacterium]